MVVARHGSIRLTLWKVYIAKVGSPGVKRVLQAEAFGRSDVSVLVYFKSVAELEEPGSAAGVRGERLPVPQVVSYCAPIHQSNEMR